MRHHFLAEDLDALDQRIADLKETIREVGRQMGEACEQGAETFHDNFGWEDGDRKMRMWTRRYRELVRVRELALVVEPVGDPEVVRMGRHVRFEDLDTGREQEVFIGSYLVFTRDRISCSSPLARLLIGAREGELREGTLGERKVTIEVLEVRQPERERAAS
jgi:transcription elongation GreA/GreB family factor